MPRHSAHNMVYSRQDAAPTFHSCAQAEGRPGLRRDGDDDDDDSQSGYARRPYEPSLITASFVFVLGST